jgi:hypothetical protein
MKIKFGNLDNPANNNFILIINEIIDKPFLFNVPK